MCFLPLIKRNPSFVLYSQTHEYSHQRYTNLIFASHVFCECGGDVASVNIITQRREGVK